jgi:hypothetical protein
MSMRFVERGAPRRSVATFRTYEDAQRAVDSLSDRGFPVEKAAIVGHGLRYVEQVTGRMTTGRAALLGALQGAVIGLLFSVLMALIFTYDPNPAVWLLILYGLAAGALIGAVFGAILHLTTGGERDFASVQAMQADRFDVMVDEDAADRAASLLRAATLSEARPETRSET